MSESEGISPAGAQCAVITNYFNRRSGAARWNDDRLPWRSARGRQRLRSRVILFAYQDHIPNQIHLARGSEGIFVFYFTSRRDRSEIDCKHVYNHTEIPENILRAPRKLTHKEFNVMKRHPKMFDRLIFEKFCYSLI